MPVAGQGRLGILVVGEAPGQTEDEKGIPFVGKTGHHLQDVITRAGFDLFRDCWITNSARCRPPGNTLPEKAVDHCRPYLLRAIEELQPRVILLLGRHAMRSCLEPLGRDDVSGDGVVRKWAGWRIPCQKWNCWIVPTYHPSHVLRSLDEKRGTGQVIANDFARHVTDAFKAPDRPWDEVPDWPSTVRLVHNPEEVAFHVDGIREEGGPVAFDYETNMLKPDHGDSRIVCCSVSDGVVTYAFPWVGQAVGAVKRLLTSDVPKYGWSLKFETRWSLAKLGVWVRNWAWDGMTTAHALDPRPGISGLKFQSFARLGVADYSSHIDPYLKGTGGYGKNRIREADLDSVLRYCGLDSLYEYKLCRLQMKDLGVD
jgi:DNA polymerase